MADTAYVPAAGLGGKMRRTAARVFARAPLKVALGRSIISFTFDDFPKSAATRGAHLLEQEGWRGTYFAAGGFAGGRNHHGALFDSSDLHRLAKAGHEIACHTYSHTDAAQSDVQDFVHDVDRNGVFLKACGHEDALETFAFPYGEATAQTKRALAGRFRALRGVQPGVNRGQVDRALLRSVPMDGGLTGLHRAIDAVRDVTQKPGWLIFYGHDIQDLPTQWGCTPDFLEALIGAARSSGAEVLTMKAALDKIEAGAS